MRGSRPRLKSRRSWDITGKIAWEETMKLSSSSFAPNGPIPAEFAFCAPDPKSHVTLSRNRNPHLSWSELPAGTKSLALICHDPDVPSKPDDVNREGRTIPANLPRVDFYHWVLVDLDQIGRAHV